MEDFFKQLLQIYKKNTKVKQIKKKFIENFSKFYISFLDQYKDPKKKEDKYLKVKQLGINYIIINQNSLYLEFNR